MERWDALHGIRYYILKTLGTCIAQTKVLERMYPLVKGDIVVLKFQRPRIFVFFTLERTSFSKMLVVMLGGKEIYIYIGYLLWRRQNGRWWRKEVGLAMINDVDVGGGVREVYMNNGEAVMVEVYGTCSWYCVYTDWRIG